ncbi:hypothetical protein ACFQ9X_55950 [Catenulispora yoronensis]
MQVALNTTGVSFVRADQESKVLAMSATTELHSGALLNPADVSSVPPTPPGAALVVINLKNLLMPSGIVPGKKLTLVVNGVVSDQAGKYTIAADSAGARVLSGAKPATFKVTVVSVSQAAAGAAGKVTLAVDPNDAPNIELFADEQRLGVIVPPTGQ